MTKLYTKKMMTVWIAISAVIIVAGIVMGALLGFNDNAKAGKTLEVTYDAVIIIEDDEKAVQEACEKVFESNHLAVSEKKEPERSLEIMVDSSTGEYYYSESSEYKVQYVFDGATADATMNSVKTAVEQALAQFGNANVSVSWHTLDETATMIENVWRGAIAIAVGVIVALIYVGFRYGIGQAVAGLVAACNDVLLTLAILAIVRIPVVSYTAVVVAGISAFISMLLWLLLCGKIREAFKDPSFRAMGAEEAVGEAVGGAKKLLLSVIVAIAVVVVVIGAVAASGVRMFMIPVLIALAVSTYSSLVLAPSVLTPIKSAIDRYQARKVRYNGKKKAEQSDQAE